MGGDRVGDFCVGRIPVEASRREGAARLRERAAYVVDLVEAGEIFAGEGTDGGRGIFGACGPNRGLEFAERASDCCERVGVCQNGLQVADRPIGLVHGPPVGQPGLALGAGEVDELLPGVLPHGRNSGQELRLVREQIRDFRLRPADPVRVLIALQLEDVGPDFLDFLVNFARIGFEAADLAVQRFVTGREPHDLGLGGTNRIDHGKHAACLVEPRLQRLGVGLREDRHVELVRVLDGRLNPISVLVVEGEEMFFDAGLQARILWRRRGVRREEGLVGQEVHQAREEADDCQADQLQADEDRDALVHVGGLDLGRRDAAKVEQRKAEGGREKRGLHVHADHHTEPHGGDISGRIGQQDRGDDGNHHHGDLDEIEEESEDEDHRHHDDELGPEPAGKAAEELAHQFFAAEGAEGGGQHRRAEQDDEHHRGGLGRLDHHAAQCVLDLEGAPGAPDDRDQQADNGHGGERDSERIPAVVDGLHVQVEQVAQDEDRGDRYDREDRRIEGAALAFLEAVSCHDHGTHGADGAGLVHRGDAHDDRAQNGEDQGQRRDERQQDPAREAEVVSAVIGNRWRGILLQQREHQNIERVQADKHETREQCAEEHVAGAGRRDVEFARHGDLAGTELVLELACGAGLVGRIG